jgi:uncharacterized membrane protein YqaE (UPF0057 family)
MVFMALVFQLFLNTVVATVLPNAAVALQVGRLGVSVAVEITAL